MCIAGVFGGQEKAGISDTTTNVFLKVLVFDLGICS